LRRCKDVSFSIMFIEKIRQHELPFKAQLLYRWIHRKRLLWFINKSGQVFKEARLYAYDSISLRIQTSTINYDISSQTKREAKAKNVKSSRKVYHR
jgi:hypothetical protein